MEHDHTNGSHGHDSAHVHGENCNHSSEGHDEGHSHDHQHNHSQYDTAGFIDITGGKQLTLCDDFA